MKKTLLLLTSIFIFNLTVRSQDDATILVRTLYSDNTINKMLANYQNYFKQIASTTYKNELDSNYVKFMDYAFVEMKGILTSMMENDLVPLFKKIYTADELKELSGFYGSAIGKKYIEKSPDISKGIQDLMVEKYLPDMKVNLEKYIKASKK